MGLPFQWPQFRGAEKEGPMDRNDIVEDGIEELGIASVETLGSAPPFPEDQTLSPVPIGGGITAE
jgi:hypothetical protein